MRYLLLLLCVTAQAATPIAAFQPRMLPNGDREWTFVVTPIPPDAALNAMIAARMGETGFCAHGWEILKRDVQMKNYLTVEGRCLSK